MGVIPVGLGALGGYYWAKDNKTAGIVCILAGVGVEILATVLFSRVGMSLEETRAQTRLRWIV